MPRNLLPAIVSALVCCLCWSCGDSTNPPAAPTGAAQDAGDSPKTIRFTEVGASGGVTLRNVSGDPIAKLAIPENIGQGVALIDFDGDGLLDIFIPNGDVFSGQTPSSPARCALYRNLGDWKFEDVTAAAGLDFKAWVHGAYAVDFDGDGDRDLYLTCYLGANRFFRNEGDGTFSDQSETFGGADRGPSTAAAFFDADGDGDLDLYVGNYVDYDPKNPPNGGRPCDYHGIESSCGPRGTTPAADTFFENVDGHLLDATEKFGFTSLPGYALGVVAADLDEDGDIDLFVANDSTVNFHFVNKGNGRFEDEAEWLNTGSSRDGINQAGMGVDAGDLNGDGLTDLYVTHFAQDYNTLYLQDRTVDGRVMFTDATAGVGLNPPTFHKLSWGTGMVDIDHDGLKDLVVASGHVYPQVDQADLETSYRQKNQIFLGQPAQNGRSFFLEHEPAAGDGMQKLACSRGFAWGDLDNDGDLDFVFNEIDDLPTVLRNDSQGLPQWISLALEGQGKNREAIGAQVVVIDSSGKRYVDQKTHGESYLSSVDPRLHFGLGTDPGPVSIEVRWPNGKKSIYNDVPVGCIHRLREGADQALPWPK